MRALATSLPKELRLVQRWVTPGAVELVIETSGMSVVPSSASMTTLLGDRA
jgi:hypothetical protein